MGRVFQWLLFAAFVAIGFGWFAGGKQLAEAASLRASTAQVSGVITSVSPGNSLNNPTAYYTFQVNGTVQYGYSNVRQSTATNLAPGAAVQVTYNARNPSSNAIDTEGIAEAGRRGIFIACIIELVLAAIFIPLIVTAGPSATRTKSINGQNVAGVVVISIMALAGLGALFFGVLPGYQKRQALLHEGKTAVASITGVYDRSKGNGRYAEYSYVVDGANYHGKADYRGGYGDRQQINIVYLPSDPSFSAINPEAAVGSARGSILFMALWLAILSLFAGLVFYKWRTTSA